MPRGALLRHDVVERFRRLGQKGSTSRTGHPASEDPFDHFIGVVTLLEFPNAASVDTKVCGRLIGEVRFGKI
jgi:hypothetical protein